MNNMLQYGFRAELKIQIPLSTMSGEDKIRLCKDLIRDLLLTDGLKEEYRKELQDYMTKALEESK